jgi:hypothetical protein
MKRLLAVMIAATTGIGPSWAEVARVTADRVNVRAAPAVTSAVVAGLARGDEVEVLGRQGDWLRVKLASGIEGYVLARLATLVAAPPTPPPPTAPPAAPPAPPLSIEHTPLGCVVAGRHPRVAACVRPLNQVGRARVTFRASGTSPWYAVDMSGPECPAALLPKPKPEITSFQYFVEVIDTAFVARQEPATAPDRSHQPRVVKNENECRELAGMVTSRGPASIVVRAVRDASGRILDSAAAQVLEAPASISGFSMDGVALGEAKPGVQSGAAGAAAASGGSKTLLIVGGVAAAGAGVALAAGGGGSESGSTPAPTTLTGRWIGAVAEGNGITFEGTADPVRCVFRWDTTVDLTQSGSTLSGSGSSVQRSATCSPSSPELERILQTAVGNTGSGSLTGTASGGQITFTTGDLVFTGTYTSSLIDVRATQPDPIGTFVWTWRMARR